MKAVNPKLKIRRSEERGLNEMSWLRSAHTFSFGSYYDPSHRSFHSLRVINEDWIRAGAGFPPHPHEDMEILTYPVAGALRHRDSTGSEGVIVAGDIQLMSAGYGIVHSEFNASDKEDVHLLQIWIYPSQKGLTPRYQQQNILEPLEAHAWTRLVHADQTRWSWVEDLKVAGAKMDTSRSLEARQSIEVWGKRNLSGESFSLESKTSYSYWLQLIKGQVKVMNEVLQAGDALSLEGTKNLNFISETESEFILFVF